MKRIYGITIWFWAGCIAVLLGIGWTVVSNRKIEPTDTGKKCLEAAKFMLITERSIKLDEIIASIIGRRSLSAEKMEKSKRDKRELERRTRAYNKMLERLKDEESFFHRESAAIERWVNEGRAKMKELPRTERAMRGMDAERADTEWEIFMECDMVDLLKARG